MQPAIEMLAEYLTGPEYEHHQLGLRMPDTTKMHERAKTFFALREALGVAGEMTAAKAASVIRNQLEQRL